MELACQPLVSFSNWRKGPYQVSKHVGVMQRFGVMWMMITKAVSRISQPCATTEVTLTKVHRRFHLINEFPDVRIMFEANFDCSEQFLKVADHPCGPKNDDLHACFAP